MEPVYVFGHRNPDTDSVVSAIAYAALRNAKGGGNYIPAVLGEINDQTAAVLSRFGFKAPEMLYTVKTQVRDLEYDIPPVIKKTADAGEAWKIFKYDAYNGAVPVTDEEGRLAGMLTKGDIAEYIMETLDGMQMDLSASEAFRLVCRSVNAGRLCSGENIVSFRLDDYLDKVKEQILQSRYRSYPILDGNEKVAGTLSRFHLLNPKRKKVVLVDHNEVSQSVSGLEQAEILEIIDHHRLGDVQTQAPAAIRCEPLGSTATIIARMYREKKITPSPEMAGLLAAAILSDTVLFKSPTCTQTDIQTAKRLEKLCGISLEDIGRKMFSAGTDLTAGAEALLHSDFKEFRLAGHFIGIGQLTCLDSGTVLKRADEFLSCMQKEAAGKNYEMVLFMISDVLKNGSTLLVSGDSRVISQAFGEPVADGRVFLPGVLSRKKQVVPALFRQWG
ncbi:MAG: putative manganese-dependent inorganic diphosphatase [Eubacterium sp.]|nr:putative manganese-dependent inorganic diphosphatase [Eubacterium sp.]